MAMKKLVTLASVGVFLLSLQGASLAQEKRGEPRRSCRQLRRPWRGRPPRLR